MGTCFAAKTFDEFDELSLFPHIIQFSSAKQRFILLFVYFKFCNKELISSIIHTYIQQGLKQLNATLYQKSIISTEHMLFYS